MNDQKGLLAALFDFSFEHFVALKFAKIVYGLLLVGWGLLWIVFLLGVLTGDAGGAEKAFMLVIVFPVGALLSLIYVRVIMELLLVQFRIAENTRQMATSLDGSRAAQTPQPYGGATPPPAYPG